MKKYLAILMAAAMLMALFAGCGVSTDTGESDAATTAAGASASSDQDNVDITWCFWDDLTATDDLITKGYADVIQRYNDADNGYHCNVVTTNLEEYDGKMTALIAAGKCPDVWICNPGPNMDVYVNEGVAMDLTGVLTEQNKDWYDTFTKGIFDRMTYDGKIMAVPTNFAAACAFYNTGMFKNAGCEVPTTLDELCDVCDKLQAAGYQPITCSAGTAWCLSMIAGYLCDREGGPDNLKAITDGTGSWLDESYVNAANDLLRLSKYFQPSAASDTNDECTAQFYNEQAAILIQGSWAIAQINGANPDFEDKCGVFAFPGVEGGGDPNRMIVKTDNLMVKADLDEEHLAAVVELLKYFTDEPAQKYTAEIAGKIPIISVDIDYDKAPKQLSYVMDVLSKSTGTLGFYNESLATVEAGDTFDNNMVAIVLGQKTVQEALQDLQTWYEDNVWNS